MYYTTPRSDWSRRAAGIFTLLIVLVMAVTSYAAASSLLGSPDPDKNGTTGDNLIAIKGKTPEMPVTAPRIVATATATVGVRRVPTSRVIPTAVSEAQSDLDTEGAEGITADDGLIPEGQTLSPFANHPAVQNLDPELREAVQLATADANADGVEIVINSGWRSERYQQALLDEAIVTYGSEAEARKWVKTPKESSHVTGDAVDIGYTDADYWLIEHGSDYGLCQIYENEIWHFELATTPGGTCPTPVTDATS